MPASTTPLPRRALPADFLSRPIAHRGLHSSGAGIIENTRRAFTCAIDGRFGIECDIQISADGEAMVFHDFDLDRLTKTKGRVDTLSAEALRACRFKAGADGMETLADLFDLVAGRVPLVVEIKSRFDGDSRIAPRVAALAHGYSGPLVFKSFDPAKIIALREAGVQQPLGIVGEARYEHGEYEKLSAMERHALANLLHFDLSRPDFLSWNRKDLPSAGPFLCRSALGMPVMSWTVRTTEEAIAVGPHADQIVFEQFLPE